MNYKKYYELQSGLGHHATGHMDTDLVGSGMPVFRGHPFQKGHGLGGVFKRFFRFLLPVLKTHALPAMKKGAQVIGTEAVKAAANIARDTISGNDVKESAKTHLNEAIDTISNHAQSSLQNGKGLRKRAYKSSSVESLYTKIKRRPKKKFRRKEFKDIFD